MKTQSNRYHELCELLHDAIYGNKCMICAAQRCKQGKLCKKCDDLCGPKRARYDEIAIRIKIHKED